MIIKFEQNDISKNNINRFFVELQCSDLKGNYNQNIWKQVNLLDSDKLIEDNKIAVIDLKENKLTGVDQKKQKEGDYQICEIVND